MCQLSNINYSYSHPIINWVVRGRVDSRRPFKANSIDMYSASIDLINSFLIIFVSQYLQILQ